MQFKNLGLPSIEYGKARESFIDGQYVDSRAACGSDHAFVERYLKGSASSLSCAMRTGVVHQDVSHHIGGQPQNTGAVVPHGIRAISEPQVGFMYQRGGLEGVIATLEAHFACCQPVQFRIQARGENRPIFGHQWRQR